jgi:hypothetical protein
MVSRLYSLLLRLHPRAFRERFSEEMLSIFDESPRKHPLLLDACASLLRQWVLRSGARDRPAPIAAPARRSLMLPQPWQRSTSIATAS